MMNIAVFIYSRQMSRWGLQKIDVTFIFEGNAPIPVCVNASMFTRIIREPASSTEQVSIRVFYESLQIAFPNNVLVCQFRGWNVQYAHYPTEERGRVSRAH